jgi:RNA polymerase sigma factor (sigma-70 family)
MTDTPTMNLDHLMSHAGWLRRLAGGLLPDGGGADDAVQETLITALRRPPDARGSARGWFGTVLTNRIRTQARSEQRRRKAAARAAEQPDAEVRTPEEVVAQLELQRVVAAVLLSLSEPHRQVIYLRYFDDLDSGAIARQLGIPAGTVRWRLKTALDELRTRLDAGDSEGGRKWRRLVAPLAPPAGAALAPAAAVPVLPALAVAATVVVLAIGAIGVARFAGGGSADGVRATGASDPAGAAAPPAGNARSLPSFVGGATEPPGAPGAGAPSPVGAGGALAVAATDGEPDPDAPAIGAVAPFTGVRWRGEIPEVEVNDAWVELVAIDGLASERIVAFAKQRYPKPADVLWRKRFSEDLVDVLTAMERPPRRKVELTVKDLKDGRTSTVRAAMTKENRQRTWKHNNPSAAAQPRPLVDRFARVSPFSGLRFRGEVIEVELEGRWYRLAATSGVATPKMIAFAKGEYDTRWRKRIAEDLVEVLTGLGVRPADKVDLVLEGLADGARTERRGVPLTEENRKRVARTWEEQSR